MDGRWHVEADWEVQDHHELDLPRWPRAWNIPCSRLESQTLASTADLYCRPSWSVFPAVIARARGERALEQMTGAEAGELSVR